MSRSHIPEEYNVSRETYQKLELYCDLVVKWQKALNLVSPATLPGLWQRHIIDSLQLLPLLPTNETSRIYDIGSGGGFPALPLAIASGLHFTLIESDTRKAIFLREAIRLLEVNASVISQRAETVSGISTDLITARACAPLSKLLSWAEPLLSPEGKCLFPKGEDYRKELDQAYQDWDFSCETIASITQSEAAILIIKQLKRR